MPAALGSSPQSGSGRVAATCAVAGAAQTKGIALTRRRRQKAGGKAGQEDFEEVPVGSKACTICITTNKVYKTLFASALPSELDALICNLRPNAGLGGSEALAQIRDHLFVHGFTVALDSHELREAVRLMGDEDLDVLRRSRMTPSLHGSSMARGAVAQLRRILPDAFAVLGLYKARTRKTNADHAACLHKDDVLLTEDEVRLSLFPQDASTGDDLFERYLEFCGDARRAYPSLELPCAPDNGDVRALTRDLVEGVRRYNAGCARRDDELRFDNINLWIPRDTKQLVLLPLSHSQGLRYPLGSAEVEMLEGRHKAEFRASPRNSALVFFGQSLLHQALLGPEFDCGTGSVEGRYLALTTQKQAHSGSLRDRLFEEQPCSADEPS